LLVILFEFAHFKQINDTYGHRVGDQVLTSLVSQLQEVPRSGDL
jgi:diguanylate cyclase (GGDEF)-like protein